MGGIAPLTINRETTALDWKTFGLLLAGLAAAAFGLWLILRK